MPKSQKKPDSGKPDSKKKSAARSGVPLGVTYVDEEISAAMKAYIAEHNLTADHPASQRSTVEAALKMYLAPKGFWPWPRPEKPPEKQGG